MPARARPHPSPAEEPLARFACSGVSSVQSAGLSRLTTQSLRGLLQNCFHSLPSARPAASVISLPFKATYACLVFVFLGARFVCAPVRNIHNSFATQIGPTSKYTGP